MAFFVGDLMEVAKENRTGQKNSEGGRAYIQAINNDDDDDGDSRGTKRPRYLGETGATRPSEPVQSTTIQ